MNYLVDSFRHSYQPLVRDGYVHRKIGFRVGYFALAGLISIGASSSESAVKKTAKSTKSVVTKRTTAYSAERSQSRKTKLAQARATATAREMAETVLPRYKVDASGGLVPDVRAAAAIIYDPETNEILWEENAQTQRSIASITKVMTATVFLENDPDLSQPVTIARSDVFQASTTHLRANDKVTTDDLLHLLLIASDNAAARALARVSPEGSDGFIRRMNEKASELGLETTHYADPSGLLSDNVSSAYDMARLIAHASQDERISSIMRTSGVHGLQRRQAADYVPEHEPPAARRRCGSAGGEDRLHLQGRLLPGDRAAIAAEQPRRRRRRLRRPLERGPLHGIAQPVQLGISQGGDVVRRQASHSRVTAVSQKAAERRKER